MSNLAARLYPLRRLASDPLTWVLINAGFALSDLGIAAAELGTWMTKRGVDRYQAAKARKGR